VRVIAAGRAVALALLGRIGLSRPRRDPADRIDVRSPEGDAFLSRAEALRQAMLAYLDDKSSDRNAYPAPWDRLLRSANALCASMLVHSRIAASNATECRDEITR
jgi:hypothetical protein